MAASSQRTLFGIEFHSRGVVPTARRCAFAELAHYMAQYDHEHSSGWNRLLHGLGIPMIFLGDYSADSDEVDFRSEVFVGGWVFLPLGHNIERNHPAFFQGSIFCW
jgi:uncharacterized membrane protein YGL010W